MTEAAKKVFEQALALSEAEREELVEVLSQSLPPAELSPQWKAELVRRVEKIESGRAILHDAGSHAQALRAKFS